VVEQGTGFEEEAKFTPAVELSYPEEESPQPINEEPIELTPEEYEQIAAADSDEDDEVKALMEAKGMPLDQVVKIKVGDRILNITTDPNDLGTWIQ
jgi:C-terminal processing protease CtpA/Prc